MFNKYTRRIIKAEIKAQNDGHMMMDMYWYATTRPIRSDFDKEFIETCKEIGHYFSSDPNYRHPYWYDFFCVMTTYNDMEHNITCKIEDFLTMVPPMEA